MIKKISLVCLSILLLSACTLLPNQNSTSNTPSNNSTLKLISITPTISSVKTQTPTVNSSTIVNLKTKNGSIIIKLYDTTCPNTVKNFLSKVKSNFYNNLTFHRVISDFMAQGGDPKGDGSGGGQQKSEINDLPFKRGSLGLARLPGNKEYSNDSQFFICFTTEGCQHLTGDYVNFGEVISGLDVLDKIVQDDKIISISIDTK